MLYTRKYIDTIDIIHLLIFINIEVTFPALSRVITQR